MTTRGTNEMNVAMEIVRFLMGRDSAQRVSDDGDTISFRLEPRPGWKLRNVVFSRAALERLAGDPDRAVKQDYLRREILRAAAHRAEYRYPRVLPKRKLDVPAGYVSCNLR